MKTWWYRLTYLIALLLISMSFGFSASIWSTPPSLGYLAIAYSLVFAIILTLSWCTTFWKSKYGKIVLIFNSIIGLISIGFLMKQSAGFEDYQRFINVIFNILAAISTLIFGLMYYFKKNTHNTK